ncbi:hypothetical protein H072_4454 [Dactylellina haptotyla CBS 200.50]|uniref:Rhodopsin domain-containing protein n=1 Tax=Dactylellina haptotyla (strain CBS 200.50) TaxID=1284197 RepID=S8C210_DACHA|nr:hypothetical protein H072_4454 [Dactylellina haptotyla CBS 200.50]
MSAPVPTSTDPAFHESSVDLSSPINQSQKFAALIERFGRWPAYMTGDPIISRGNELFIPIIVLGALSILSTVLRLYVRGFVVRSIGWDDGTMIVALAATIVFNAIYMWAVKGGGLGRYEIDVPLEMWPALFKAMFLNPIIYHISIGFLKASICLFLLRIATVKIYRQVLWGTMIFSSVFLFTFMVVTACQCDYLDLFYGRKTNSWCLKAGVVEHASFGTAAGNIVTDFILVIIPIPMLWKVNISRLKKFLIRLIISLGLFASFATIIRLIYLLVYPPYGNVTYHIEFEIWSVVELNSGIIVANIPALAPLIKGFLENRKNSRGNTPQHTSDTAKFKWGKIRLPGQRGRQVKSTRQWQLTLGSVISIFGRDDGDDEKVGDGSGSASDGSWSWGSTDGTSNGSTVPKYKKDRKRRGSSLTSFTAIGDVEKGWGDYSMDEGKQAEMSLRATKGKSLGGAPPIASAASFTEKHRKSQGAELEMIEHKNRLLVAPFLAQTPRNLCLNSNPEGGENLREQVDKFPSLPKRSITGSFIRRV